MPRLCRAELNPTKRKTNMKAILTWFAVITAALIVAGCVVLWFHRRWREQEQARTRLHWREARREAENQHRFAWENRRFIGYGAGAVTVAS